MLRSVHKSLNLWLRWYISKDCTGRFEIRLTFFTQWICPITYKPLSLKAESGFCITCREALKQVVLHQRVPLLITSKKTNDVQICAWRHCFAKTTTTTICIKDKTNKQGAEQLLDAFWLHNNVWETSRHRPWVPAGSLCVTVLLCSVTFPLHTSTTFFPTLWNIIVMYFVHNYTICSCNAFILVWSHM